MLKKIFWFLLPLALLLASCSQQGPQPTGLSATSPPIPVTSISPVVTDLEILVLADPPQTVGIVVRGSLPDGCYRLDEPRVESIEAGWLVHLTAARLAQANCTPDPVPFERLVKVKTDDRTGGKYQVSAGDQVVSFSVPEHASVAAVQASPTAVPAQTTAVPSQAASQPAPEPTVVQPEAVDGASVSPTPTDCELKAAFYADITVPDNEIFMEGEPFEKIWRIRNEGTCTWDNDYALIFAGGDILNAPLSVPLARTPPETFLDISLKMAAPAGGGAYTSLWEFQAPDGRRFGVNSGGIGKIWVKIAVRQALLGSESPDNPAGPSNPAAAPSCGGTGDPSVASTLLGLINNARAAAGLPALTLDSQLAVAAANHSQDMACNNFLDHTGSDGSTWRERIRAQGYQYGAAAENIYAGNPDFGGTSQGAFDWWMNSQVHRDNILSRKVTEIGIGYIYRPGSKFGAYFTLVFARKD